MIEKLEVNTKFSGFSKRFCEFLDYIHFPDKSRFTEGARICDVAISTFRNWCINDGLPKNLLNFYHSIEKLTHNTLLQGKEENLIAWLLTGLQQNYPFEDNDLNELAICNAVQLAHICAEKIKFPLNQLEMSKQKLIFDALAQKIIHLNLVNNDTKILSDATLTDYGSSLITAMKR